MTNLLEGKSCPKCGGGVVGQHGQEWAGKHRFSVCCTKCHQSNTILLPVNIVFTWQDYRDLGYDEALRNVGEHPYILL